jgi:uncharacterized tellurite resistance protein B-like protein
MELKENEEELLVGLIRSQTHKLLVNPHPEIQVNPGDRLVFIAPVKSAELQNGIEEDYIDKIDHPQVDIKPSAEAEKLFRKGLKLIENEDKFEEAYHCFHQAAILHHTRAKYNLGLMNFNGKGVERNLDESYHWFQEAAKYGSENARKALKSTRVLRKIRMNTVEHEIPEFDTELVDRMTDAQLFWFASAVVAMVMADEHIDLHERSFLHSAIRLVKDNKKIQELEEYILRWQAPKLSEMKFSKRDKVHLLESLLNIATVDRSFDEREEQLLYEVGVAIDVSKEEIVNLIKLGHKRIEQFRANQLRAPNVRARV